MRGLIINSIGGLYYVKTKEKIYESKPRGIFRKNKFKPIVGDICRLSVTEQGDGVIEEVYTRRNFLQRPPIANIDKLFFVVSAIAPKPNYLVLDQLISIAEKENIKPNIVITKTDLENPEHLQNIYKDIYPVFRIDYEDKSTIAILKKAMEGSVSAFSGNSGVGKSTVLNAIDGRFEIETGEISEKLGRGRHTTRAVSLYQLENGGYIADTPGFSSVDFNLMGKLAPSEVADTFVDFRPYLSQCRFNDCLHDKEIDCAIKKALEAGIIHESRYENYIYILNESKKADFW